MQLSILDQSPISEGSSASAALRNTIDLASLADKLGYHRYWVAEHHGTPALACTSPEALIGPLAAATTRLRIGSGGVMLPHYSPFKVAETFALLSGLFPGRIDLGIGRASGTDPRTSLALQRDREGPPLDDFPHQLSELLAWFNGSIPEGHPFARQAAMLAPLEKPEPWLLGSSPQSALWAAELGLPYAFADFINAGGGELASLYRSRFAGAVSKPRVMVAAWALCADTDAEAERLALSGRMLFQLFRSGTLIQVPTVARAQAYFAAAAPGLPAARRTIVGSPAKVKAGLEAVAAEYGAEEIMVVTICHDHAARRRSYELIAGAFALSAQ